MRVSNDTILSAPIDMSVAWTSDAIWLGHLRDFSIQLIFTGTPLGIFRLQCSNDRETNVETASGVTNWSIMSGSTQSISEAGDHTYAIADAGYRWLRIQWIPGLGSSGSINVARINGKGW
jgi:hypothetical protein